MARRVSIEVPGFAHDAPIPAACRVGSFLTTSVVSGKELYTGKMPEGIEAQCERMFATVRLILEAAGATPEDVVKMTVWMKDRTQRPALNKGWLEMFPDPHSRPARHTFKDDDQPYGALVSCEVIAVILDR